VNRRSDDLDLLRGFAVGRTFGTSRYWSALPPLARPATPSMVPLRRHARTYLAGGPAIAVLTAAVLVTWRTWTDVTTPALDAPLPRCPAAAA
jgi:hypothetical protein